MARPIQHHYPAALVGEFGVAAKSKHKGGSRDRLVYVARRGVPKIVQQPAAKVGFQRRNSQLYDVRVPGHEDMSIDGQWALVESRIPELERALREYDNRFGIGRELFVRVLVGLVAQLLVRHPEFATRYVARAIVAGSRYAHVSADRTGWAVNLARQVELRCISGILVDSQWWLLRSPEPLVGSDLGFAAAGVTFGGERHEGYVFPVAPNAAIYVGNGAGNFDIEQAAVRLNTRALTREEAHGTNEVTAAWAPTSVFGRDEKSVRRAIAIWEKRDDVQPLRSYVPDLLHSDRTPEAPGQAERWLRTLHRAQTLDQPGNPGLKTFEDCVGCQRTMADMALWWDNRTRELQP